MSGVGAHSGARADDDFGDDELEVAPPRSRVGATLGFMASTFILFVLLGWLGTGRWWPWGSASAPNPVLTLLGAAVTVGVAALVVRAPRVAALSQQLPVPAPAQPSVVSRPEPVPVALAYADTPGRGALPGRAEMPGRRDGSVAVSDRWDAAVTQLGHPSAPVRLAAVLGLAEVVDRYVTEGQATQAARGVDLLCGYLRMSGFGEAPSDPQRDVEVRQAIVRTISSRLRPESPVRWYDLPLDFAGADLTEGTYSFERAHFVSGQVSFTGARLGGFVSFERCTFGGAVVSFDDADFVTGVVSFAGASLRAGSLAFDGATFAGSEVSFARMTVAGGALLLGGARLVDGSMSFPGARFEGGHVSLRGALFEGTRVSFESAVFAGGQVSFGPARVTGGAVSGPWGGRKPPMAWPLSA